MFLALDESIGSQYTTVGCLCLPDDQLSHLEFDFINLRLRHKVWAEVKWEKISKAYCQKYKDILSAYLSHGDVTFHSWTYRTPSSEERTRHYNGISAEKVIYRHAYMLIRSVIWKCRNAGYQGSYYILADETGSLGQEEYKTTQSLLKGDSNIKPSPNIDFCTTGNSMSCGAMQVSDICAGAVMSHYDEKYSGQAACKSIVDHLKSLNQGRELNFSPSKLPTLKSAKLHHYLCDR
jgi:hypothetical protein